MGKVKYHIVHKDDVYDYYGQSRIKVASKGDHYLTNKDLATVTKVMNRKNIELVQGFGHYVEVRTDRMQVIMVTTVETPIELT